MHRVALLSLSCVIVLAACSTGEPGEERIKITQPAPEKGKEAESWAILQDAWTSDVDRDLVRVVRQALVDDASTVPLAEAVAIEANAGAVVLHGSGAYTLTADEWQTVGRRAKQVNGVKSVEIRSRVAAE